MNVESVKKPDRCLFCDVELSNANASNEHVIPRWLQTELEINRLPLSPTVISASTGETATRRHTINGLVEGRVCAKCNGGWMSALEVAVKPMLSDLMVARTVVVDYEQADRELLARWAAKTVYMLNSSSNLGLKVPRVHLKELFATDALPADAIVVAQQHHGTDSLNWLQSSSWQLFNVNEGSPLPNEPTSYKVTLLLGKLLLLVAYWPDPTYAYAITPGIHVPLWPRRGQIAQVTYQKEFPWDNSQEALIAFHMMLGLVPPGGNS